VTGCTQGSFTRVDDGQIGLLQKVRRLHSAKIGQAKVARKTGSTPHEIPAGGEPVQRHVDEPGAPVVLSTKLDGPHASDRILSRAALVEALEQGVRGKLTLLSAPAGWGKTTVLAQWIASQGSSHRIAWLGLDRADNDPAQFWGYLIAALRRTATALSNRASELLDVGADITEVVLPTLLNEFELHTEVTVLILDDYHLVTNAAIHEQMTLLVARMPANLRLVVATRLDPALPLARLRAGAELQELRTQDLRLSLHETTMLLNGVLRLELSGNDIRLLAERTEGWAAGLYLVALSLAGRGDKHDFVTEFASDHRHIVDYLSAEVLDGLSPDMRAFLVRTSVLTRLSGPLCDALLDTTGSASILRRIELDNLFLVPLDWSRGWYRYHHLFADLLRGELQRTEPGVIAVLHRRAAEWFRGAGLVDDAVHHLIAGGDTEVAADLVAATWAAEFNLGRLVTVSGWLDSLPSSIVSSDARLGIARAWIALDTGHLEDAGAWIDATETALAARDRDPGTLPAELVILRAVCQFKIGDVGACLGLAQRAIALDLGNARLGPSAAYCIYGSALYWSGRTPEAQAAYRRAARLAARVNNHLGRAYALGYLAVIAAEQGLLDEAELLVAQITRDLAAGEHFVDMMSALAKAKIFDRRGDTASAAEAARMAVALAKRGGGVIEVAHALVTQSQVLGHLGDGDAAHTTVAEAGRVLQTAADPGQARELLAAASLTSTARPPRQAGAASPGQELSTKELDVLRLMAMPLSRREIGTRLFVSVNTVKSHQRALYRKLGVANRTDAVDRARQRGIL
jgi:LuxR family maltose regulon positive regulatory protein